MNGFGENAPLERIRDLEQRFTSMQQDLEPSPAKEAISVLHGMIQELLRIVDWRHTPPGAGDDNSIAELYKKAPKMEGEALTKPLPTGVPAPDFTLLDASGEPVSLKDYRGRKVLLVFYPLDWSPGCSQQLDLYASEAAEFAKRGVEVVAISVDSIYSHGAWAQVRKLPFPLLADFHPKGEVARRYGVYRDPDGYSDRALYLIDEEGTIRYSHVSPQLHHVPDIYELFSAIDSLEAAAA